MKRKSRKKRARSQGQKLAELRKQASTQYKLGKKAFAGGVKYMIRCGVYLLEAKAELPHGKWLPWLDGSGIPERSAQRCMQLAKNRNKIEAAIKGKSVRLSDLSLEAALNLLAPSEAAETGALLSLAEIEQQVQAEHLYAPPIEPSGTRPMLTITARPQAPSKRRSLMSGDFALPAVNLFTHQLALFACYLAGHEPKEIATALPAVQHADAIAAADKIAAFLNALKRALWESGRPRLVSDGGDEGGR